MKAAMMNACCGNKCWIFGSVNPHHCSVNEIHPFCIPPHVPDVHHQLSTNMSMDVSTPAQGQPILGAG